MKRRDWLLLQLPLIVLVFVLRASAHHSFAAEFDDKKPVKLDGTVVKFEFMNPHSWIHVQGEDPFKRPKVYSVEWASVSRLERDGITKRTLREGDWVRTPIGVLETKTVS